MKQPLEIQIRSTTGASEVKARLQKLATLLKDSPADLAMEAVVLASSEAALIIALRIYRPPPAPPKATPPRQSHGQPSEAP